MQYRSPVGLRAIGKHVSQVPAAAGAGHFDAAHAQGVVFVGVDFVLTQRLVEAGPAAPGIELGVRQEQLLPTSRALVHARSHHAFVLSAEGPSRFPSAAARDTAPGSAPYATVPRFSSFCRPYSSSRHWIPCSGFRCSYRDTPSTSFASLTAKCLDFLNCAIVFPRLTRHAQL